MTIFRYNEEQFYIEHDDETQKSKVSNGRGEEFTQEQLDHPLVQKLIIDLIEAHKRLDQIKNDHIHLLSATKIPAGFAMTLIRNTERLNQTANEMEHLNQMTAFLDYPQGDINPQR